MKKLPGQENQHEMIRKIIDDKKVLRKMMTDKKDTATLVFIAQLTLM